MADVYLVPGVRTPFVKGGTFYAQYDALGLSAPVAKAMAARARPDFIIWGEVIPEPTVSNIARELVFEAGLDPDHPGRLHRARLLDQLHGRDRGRPA